MISPVITWVMLMLLLGLEVLAAVLHAGWLAYGLAPVMIALVAFRFMHIGRQSALTRIFALAGLFWLVVLLGLGSIDYIVRRDVQVPVVTVPR